MVYLWLFVVLGFCELRTRFGPRKFHFAPLGIAMWLKFWLQDPTGTIGATIHRRAISEGEFGKRISVGAVLVLQKVGVSHLLLEFHITLNADFPLLSCDLETSVTISNVGMTNECLFYQVAVFSPSRSACYLNVTLNNIVKVHSLFS